MTDLIFSSSIDEIHTFDSYLGPFQKEGNNLIVPAINVGVSNHPLNPTSEMKYIDKSYLLFEQCDDIRTEFDVLLQVPGSVVFHLGGVEMETRVHQEWRIICKRVHLLLPGSSKLSDEMWRRDMFSQKEIDRFLTSPVNTSEWPGSTTGTA